MGVAMLVGPPICGYLHDTYDVYQPIFILNAAFILITSVFLFVSLGLKLMEKQVNQRSTK